ncbi:pyridoxal-dependent decarboxylase [Micromonospora radicis]|uniref:Pyridoxal-dependent decarboxylase n=2 Tax=Micromonospora radicis TaxID=1894971 RepID=A0A418N222_9ACTN|nr:pyridoxal-dependent decarboxylase [Micromonospora radicis]
MRQLRTLVGDVLDVLGDVGEGRATPVAPGGPTAVRAYAEDVLAEPLLPAAGGKPAEVLRQLVQAYANWAVDVSHPATVARMQCPPTAVAVAADLVTSALNQSMHAWEAGPFALELERRLIQDLADLVGYGTDAGGTVTAGGSISNIMAMLVARDEAYQRRFGRSTFDSGIAVGGVRPVVLCTETVHFSVDRGASIAGIGADGIIRVPADELGRMIPAEADRILTELPAGHLPVMLFVCAGSTDFGWVDPLPELAEVARRHGVWLHADAAYGGGALFSDRLRPLFDGLAEADSVTLDLHKFGWVPASAGIFLTRDAAHLEHLAAQQTSLNAPDDVAEGFVGRYGHSIQATRRCDALKIAATLRAYGRDGIGAMVDACHDLSRYGAARVGREPKLELAAEPVLSTVLFRYLPDGDTDVDTFNSGLRRQLMRDGHAMLARVFLPNAGGGKDVWLKLMLLNPATTGEQLDQVIDDVLAAGAALEAAGRS